jgi:YihY family inner membrane protein
MSPEVQSAIAPVAATGSSHSSAWQAEREDLKPRLVSTARYLMQTEVHTYAFSVAANAILSFFPFIVLLLTLTRSMLHSRAMYNVVIQLLESYLPAGQEFVIRNLTIVAAQRGVKLASLVILLFTSTGVFLPLEVALNKVWGIPRNRSYWKNQLISLLLAFGAGLLALASIALTAGNQALLQSFFGTNNFAIRTATFVVMKLFAVAASVGIFFLIYWLLPNGKVPARAVLPAAIAAGVLWDAGKYVYILALPWLDFQNVYGPFSLSVTLMFWAFLSGLLLLGGAYLSAARAQQAD